MTKEQSIPPAAGAALYLPLWQRDGATFASADAYGHLCANTGATWTPQGRVFDGVDDYINLNDPFEAVAGSASKTLIAWAIAGKTNFTTRGRVLTLLRTTGNTAFSFFAEGNPATWRLFYVVGTTLKTLDSGVNVVVGQPVFLAATMDGMNVTLQVNEQIFSASDGGAPTMDNPPAAYVGAYNNGGTPLQFFQGAIGEALIYNRCLTLPEIQRHYLATGWRYG